MWFDFTDEQEMLRETVHDFVERECSKRVAREVERPRHCDRRKRAPGDL
jgi:alkylation response protein AidB-like acyl-CoA dehydrogenase